VVVWVGVVLVVVVVRQRGVHLYRCLYDVLWIS